MSTSQTISQLLLMGSPILRESEIHVWKVRLDEETFLRASGAAVLDASEVAQAARYRLSADRMRFLTRRTALRSILSSYLGIPAADIELTKTESGRPELSGRGLGRALDFNVSHTADMALVALSKRTVGVDVERLERKVDMEGIASAWFAPAEVACIWSGFHGSALRGFFYHWTAKEAYLKAVGCGISALSQVRLECGATPVVWWQGERDMCRLARALCVSRSHAAAVVSDVTTVRRFSWGSS